MRHRERGEEVISSRIRNERSERFARHVSARSLGARSHDDRDDAEAAEADLVPITKLAPTFETNGIFVVEGAVRRTEVMQDKPTTFAVDGCVMRGRRAMRDLDVELLTRVGAADAVAPLPKRPELSKRIVLIADEKPSKRTPLLTGRSTAMSRRCLRTAERRRRTASWTWWSRRFLALGIPIRSRWRAIPPVRSHWRRRWRWAKSSSRS